MSRTQMTNKSVLMTLVVGTLFSRSVMAECPSSLSYEELESCIICEGAGMTYEKCQLETEEALRNLARDSDKKSETGDKQFSLKEQ